MQISFTKATKKRSKARIAIDGCAYDEQVVGRFWSHVSVGDYDECWEWSETYRHPLGYGQFKIDGRSCKAHRVSYEINKGSADGLCVLHKCDNPPCVNPNHLFLGTPKDNALDRKAKDRGVRPIGETNGRAKLAADDVIQIRKLCQDGDLSYSEIGRLYGVTKVLVGKINRRDLWKHI